MNLMILVDKDIKRLSKDLIVTGYKEENVNAVSYDLSIDQIVLEDGNKDCYCLDPNEVVFIKTNEEISMPRNLMGRIGEKNSRMRLGLFVSGPHYFPGHRTYMFLRVMNISSNQIEIKKGDKIAQIFFEELIQEPEADYSMQEGSSFNNESQYRGLGNYQSEYSKHITKIEKLNQDLDRKENSIYVNIMTFMGLFVSIFSLITLNFSNYKVDLSKESIIAMNLSLGLVICLFMGLILIFLNRAKSKKYLFTYVSLMIILILILLLIL